ncbi:MAG: ATPase [Candidatus Marinimicrobia bacterium]|nr:ATPase [Candidatus Neomarinimicrobiota bacterium]
MLNNHQLRNTLTKIDRLGYKAYKKIQGQFAFREFKLFIDHVQGDPFAEPSKIRLRVMSKISEFPSHLWKNPIRKIALEDFVARVVKDKIKKTTTPKKGTGKSGLIFIDVGGQEVLERTAIFITENWIDARLQIGFPASGRRILGHEAIRILCYEIPKIVEQSLKWKNIDQSTCTQFVECIENQESIRRQLNDKNLSAFVANGSILPRASGISDKPLSESKVVEFQSPKSLETTYELKNPLSDGQKYISGMGIPNGVTLIVGGGYHGKSTLLKALERCIYPHILGDGREYVITDPKCVKIRSEDGRQIKNVNIDPFITNLPRDISTESFCSKDASGSTSQATNIMEAMEIGCNLLLLDEDTSATNFMVRDARMQKLIHKTKEPITPFIDRVRELYEYNGVSTVLVMGGSGDYFDVADTVIKMEDYLPHNVTKETLTIMQDHPTQRQAESLKAMFVISGRIPEASSFDASHGRKKVKIRVQEQDKIIFGTETIDLRFVDQLVETSQTRAIAYAIYFASEKMVRNKVTLREIVDALDEYFNNNGLDSLDPFYKKEKHPGNFSRPRKFEIAAAINRLRSLEISEQIKS